VPPSADRSRAVDGVPPPSGAGTHRPARSLLLTLATNFGIMGLNVVTGSVNARVLGPAGRGELAAIQTIPSVLGMLALIGLPSAVGYFSARRPDEVRAFTATAASIFFMAAGPVMIGGFFLLPFALSHQPHSVVENARLYLVFVALHFGHFPYVALQGLGRFGIWNLLRPVPNLVALAAVLGTYATGHPTAGTFARWYLLLHASTIPIVYGTLWLNSKPGGEVTVDRARDLLRYGLPSALMMPAGILNLQLDQMLMAAWLPSVDLGLYVIAVSWSTLMSPIFGALGSIVFPTLAAAGDRDTQRILVGRSVRSAVLLVTLLGCGLAAVTPVLLPLLFGRSYAPAVGPALVLIAAAMLLNIGSLGHEILRGVGAPRWPMFSQLAALPVTVSLLVLLLPRWSIFGAAVSSVGAYAVILAVSLWGIRRTLALPLRDILWPRREDWQALWTVARGVVARFLPA
jgi:O-antigen/teichoic acid export membrane protein